MPSRESILVYRLGSLGDTCVALPALRVIRRAYPLANITLLTNLPINIKAAPAPALVEGTGLIDDYLAYPVGTRNPWELAMLSWRLRARKFDAVVNLAEWRGARKLRRDAWFFRVAGIRRLIGFEADGDYELRANSEGGSEREAARILRRVTALGAADLTDRRWFGLDLTAEELERGAAELRAGGIAGGYLVVSVGTKVSANDWGQERWRELLEVLGPACGHLGCVFIGSPDEAQRAAKCLEPWLGPKLNLCGRTGVRLSAAILAGASVFVGHDSGPMHLAASAGAPCVAIFAARNPPGKWFPLGEGHQVFYHRVSCMGCGLMECVAERKRCILSISVEEVAAAVLQRLGSAAPAREFN